MSTYAVPPRIPGDSMLRTLDVQNLKVENNVLVEGDIECNQLTSVTTVVAGTGMTSTTGNIVATVGNIVATAGNLVATAGTVTSADGCNLGTGASAVLDLGSTSTGAEVNIGDSAATIGFYETPAVAQPTTAITGAVFAANTSGIVDDTATFDGYTIGKVVAALRALGILA